MSQAFRILTDLSKKPELEEVPQHFVIFVKFDNQMFYLGLPAGWSSPEPECLVESGRWCGRGGDLVVYSFQKHEDAMTVVEKMIQSFSNRSYYSPAISRILQLIGEGKPYRFGIRGVLVHEFEMIAYGQE